MKQLSREIIDFLSFTFPGTDVLLFATDNNEDEIRTWKPKMLAGLIRKLKITDKQDDVANTGFANVFQNVSVVCGIDV